MADGKKYDLGFLRRIAGDDDTFIIDMLETFRSTAPGIVDKMQQYLHQKRYDALAREVHRFIPGISFLGIKDLEEDLIKVEEYSKNNQHLEQLPDLVKKVRENVELLINTFTEDFNLKSC